MFDIQNTTDLRATIQLLEIERADQLELLKKDIRKAINQVKPVSILSSTLQTLSSILPPGSSIIATLLGVATSFLTKKIIAGDSDSKTRKMLGSLFQFGMVALINQREHIAKKIGQFVLQMLFHKTEKNATVN